MNSAITHPWAAPDIVTVRTLMDDAIKLVFTRVPETQAALVSTSDGMPLVSQFSNGGDKNRISAIVSSLLAICETASREFSAGACQRAVVCAEKSSIVVIRINAHGRDFALAVAFEADLMLGTALRATTDLSQRIEEALAVLVSAATAAK